MALIKNAEIFFAKLNPSKPNRQFAPAVPTWELQLRTRDKEVKKAWEAIGINAKPIMSQDDETKFDYWRVNLSKKSIKADGTPAKPIVVVNGRLDAIDTDNIGNGSIANVRVTTREYIKDGATKTAVTLAAVQIIKLVKYEPKAFDDAFDIVEGDDSVEDDEF
jgi:hypothetical protein